MNRLTGQQLTTQVGKSVVPNTVLGAVKFPHKTIITSSKLHLAGPSVHQSRPFPGRKYTV